MKTILLAFIAIVAAATAAEQPKAASEIVVPNKFGLGIDRVAVEPTAKLKVLTITSDDSASGKAHFPRAVPLSDNGTETVVKLVTEYTYFNPEKPVAAPDGGRATKYVAETIWIGTVVSAKPDADGSIAVSLERHTMRGSRMTMNAGKMNGPSIPLVDVEKYSGVVRSGETVDATANGLGHLTFKTMEPKPDQPKPDHK